jgi:hypothetical protein
VFDKGFDSNILLKSRLSARSVYLDLRLAWSLELFEIFDARMINQYSKEDQGGF